ncbi:MAG: soluble cytochrome b562, partial [Chromatiales bacterium]
MRAVWLSLCLFCACSVTAAVDLEKTMKEMAFEYKQAYDTTDGSNMTPHLERLIALT